MQMFPFTAARLKSDIQRAAFNDVGMHTPTHWQRVVVSTHSSCADPLCLYVIWRLGTQRTLQLCSPGAWTSPNIMHCQKRVL